MYYVYVKRRVCGVCVCVCHLLQTEDECLSTENLVRLSGLA